MFWDMVWEDAGRPKTGKVFRIKKSCSFKYKMGIEQAIHKFENKFYDKLYEHFLSKETSQSWKCWNRKFHRSMASNSTSTVNGVHNDVSVANEFAKYFASVYYSSDVASEAVSGLNALRSQFKLEPTHNINVGCLINVESVNKCKQEMKLGKVSGPDGLIADLLLHVHPYLAVLLTAMFRGMVCHVQWAFRNGIIIPLVKKMDDLSSVGNYRAITFIPIISKQFDCIRLKICSDHWETDELQFGFKQELGCAIIIIIIIIYYYYYYYY